VQFVWFSYYKTTNHTAPCGVVRYGALLLAVRCGYVILRAILVCFFWFVRFMRFSEHPYLILLDTASNFALYIEIVDVCLNLVSTSIGSS